MRNLLWLAPALVVLAAPAAELAFHFGDYPLDQPPPGFRGRVAGLGKPGDWKVILDEAPPALEPLTSRAPSVSRRTVLAQLARNAEDRHYPLLIFEEGTYGDFNLTSRFKVVGGALEQMAGIVFHFQNESNFYAMGANVLGNSFQCFKVANGEWKQPVGPDVAISKGVWHELFVACEGTRILGSLDGTNVIKLIDASGNRAGKIGFWTKSDSVSYFADTIVTYARKEILAQKLVQDALQAFPRLLGLKIYAVTENGKGPAVLASKNAEDLGRAGGQTEQDVIRHGNSSFGRVQGSVLVTMPLRDRNGDPIAAVCVMLKTFPGQTDDNAAARAQPVVQRLQTHVQSLEDLLQ